MGCRQVILFCSCCYLMMLRQEASGPGNLPQSQQITAYGYQQGMQSSNSPTYLSPQQQQQQQQQQQGRGGLVSSPVYNPNTVQGQGVGAQSAPGGIQYQPVNQANGAYNGANTGYQTVAMTGYSQTGGGSNTKLLRFSNLRLANPSSCSQCHKGAQEGISKLGTPRPYNVHPVENYDGAQMVTGSSPGSRTPTTAPPPFTQAPYSQSNVPNQGVFPTALINVYPQKMSTTNGGAQGYQSSASATPYTTTPFPYGSTQHPNQGLYSENVISPSQGIYGTSTNYGPSTQSGSSMSTGQYTPSPYQTTGPQPSSSGFTPSGQTAQYTNQYDQGRMQTTQYGATSPQPPSSDYRTNNPQNQAVAVTPPSQQPFYDGSQGQTQTSPAGFATSSAPSTYNYQTVGPQSQPLDSSVGFSPSTQQPPYGYQTNSPYSETQPYTQSTPPPYLSGGTQGQTQVSSTGFVSSTQPTYATTERVANGLYGQNAYGDFVQPTVQPQQQPYSAGQSSPLVSGL
ncbi:hypothetical protein COOONC_17302 [Cooperia oncophora]